MFHRTSMCRSTTFSRRWNQCYISWQNIVYTMVFTNLHFYILPYSSIYIRNLYCFMVMLFSVLSTIITYFLCFLLSPEAKTQLSCSQVKKPSPPLSVLWELLCCRYSAHVPSMNIVFIVMWTYWIYRNILSADLDTQFTYADTNV